MKTAHWQWLGPKEKIPGKNKPMRIGKRNLINNFCISIKGNWAGCTKCPATARVKRTMTFRARKIWIASLPRLEQYLVKGAAGVPEKGADLLTAARSVGYPKRENCGTCHYYGGGGLGVKHGDLDNSLDNPGPEVDVHMGKNGFLCIDCHRTEKRQIPGRAFSVSAVHSNGINCTDFIAGLPIRMSV